MTFGKRDNLDLAGALLARILDDEMPVGSDPWGLKGDKKMGTTATDNGGGSFALVPEDNHLARCVRVIDLGTQPGSQMYPTPKHKVLLAWELPEVRHDYGGEDVPALLFKRYTLSLHENAELCKHLESWRGRAFSDEEKQGFDIAKLLGVPCQIQVVHSDNGKYANIKSISKMHPRLLETMPPAYHPLVHYEIESGENEVFRSFSDNLKATITSAPEWPGSRDDAWGNDAPPPDDSDIPFLLNTCEQPSALDASEPTRRERWVKW